MFLSVVFFERYAVLQQRKKVEHYTENCHAVSMYNV